MLSWLRGYRTKASRIPRESLLNEGLHLAMAWGEDWLMPIQKRLSKNHPNISESDLDQINATCQTAMQFGHSTIRNLASTSGGNVKFEDFQLVVLKHYPWVNSDNLSGLYSQGIYYARK